jgi:hypothetical protein
MPALSLPVKTERCRQALLDRRAPVSRARRSFLIMVDGKRALDELGIALAMLGLSDDDLHELTEAGLLAWHTTEGEAMAAPERQLVSG